MRVGLPLVDIQAKECQCICHCLTCRKLTGSTFVAGIMVPVTQIKANTESYKTSSTTHEVGMHMQFYGCPDCPSTLYKTADALGDAAIVFGGNLDGKDDLASECKPTAELWTKYRVPWLKPIDGCDQLEGFPPEMGPRN